MLEAVRVRPVPLMTRAFSSELVPGSSVVRLLCCRKVAVVIRAVAFDVGEVPVNEAREYGTWADWLGVPRHTFSAVFGAVIARGLDYRETFQVFKPGFYLDEE
jgi:hypothetical protein